MLFLLEHNYVQCMRHTLGLPGRKEWLAHIHIGVCSSGHYCLSWSGNIQSRKEKKKQKAGAMEQFQHERVNTLLIIKANRFSVLSEVDSLFDRLVEKDTRTLIRNWEQACVSNEPVVFRCNLIVWQIPHQWQDLNETCTCQKHFDKDTNTSVKGENPINSTEWMETHCLVWWMTRPPADKSMDQKKQFDIELLNQYIVISFLQCINTKGKEMLHSLNIWRLTSDWRMTIYI